MDLTGFYVDAYEPASICVSTCGICRSGSGDETDRKPGPGKPDLDDNEFPAAINSRKNVTGHLKYCTNTSMVASRAMCHFLMPTAQKKATIYEHSPLHCHDHSLSLSACHVSTLSSSMCKVAAECGI